MSQQAKVASSYARAIYDYLKSPEKTRKVAEEIGALGAIIDGNVELKRVLGVAVFTEAQRRGILEDLMAKLKVSADTVRTVLVVSAQNRMRVLSLIAERLKRIQYDEEKVVPLKVESSNELESAEKKNVEAKFKTMLGKTVEASYAVDPNLIGGLRVTAAGRTYDGSLSGQLRAIEEQLVGDTL